MTDITISNTNKHNLFNNNLCTNKRIRRKINE